MQLEAWMFEEKAKRQAVRTLLENMQFGLTPEAFVESLFHRFDLHYREGFIKEMEEYQHPERMEVMDATTEQ